MGDDKRCETCYKFGHDFLQCENECVYCRKHHSRGICPVFPEFYPKADPDSRTRGLENMREKTAQGRQRLKELNEELADADLILRQIEVIKEEVAASAGGPIPQLPAGKDAALTAMGKDASWRDVHPRWQDVSDQVALKEQWNAEALGYQQFAEDSMLKAALIYHGRWPIQRDANGFPVE
jgi:hypothetical protein